MAHEPCGSGAGYDFDPSDAADEYLVWPVDEAVLALERQQWAVFARWHLRH
ncbi:hypothetical protein ACFVXG_27510 [Kitasatospora sp. NPDC058162]|uniref:hypothetical protein n=1 Tax=Kitasatospora sp. NPDC058162 TaxID=3346362 RepID=UPI0036DA8259